MILTTRLRSIEPNDAFRSIGYGFWITPDPSHCVENVWTASNDRCSSSHNFDRSDRQTNFFPATSMQDFANFETVSCFQPVSKSRLDVRSSAYAWQSERSACISLREKKNHNCTFLHWIGRSCCRYIAMIHTHGSPGVFLGSVEVSWPESMYQLLPIRCNLVSTCSRRIPLRTAG
jgi:hypothetical protein